MTASTQLLPEDIAFLISRIGLWNALKNTWTKKQNKTKQNKTKTKKTNNQRFILNNATNGKHTLYHLGTNKIIEIK